MFLFIVIFYSCFIFYLFFKIKMLSATNTCPWLHSAFVMWLLLFAVGKGEERVCWRDWGQRWGYSWRFCSFLWWKEAWKLKLPQFSSNYLNSAQSAWNYIKVFNGWLLAMGETPILFVYFSQYPQYSMFFWILFCFLFVIFIFCVFVFIFLCLFSFWFSFY